MIFDMSGFVYAIVKVVNSKLHAWDGKTFSPIFDKALGVDSEDNDHKNFAHYIGGEIVRIQEAEDGEIDYSDV